MRPPLAEALDLQPHPEGGWFRQTWVSPESVTLPDGRIDFSDFELASISDDRAP